MPIFPEQHLLIRARSVARPGLPIMMVPAAASTRDSLLIAGVSFFLFRLFDVIKPPPARQFERLPGGWGILADDLAAGVYANVAANLILRLGMNL